MNDSAYDDDPDIDDYSIDPLEDYETLYNDSRELLEAIHQLEENIPQIGDPVGVYTALFDIYSEMENMGEAGNCLTKAAHLVDMEEHEDLIYFLYNQLELFAQLSPEAQSAYERLGKYISQDDGRLDANTLFLDQRKLYQVDLIPEVLLANHLHRSRIISDQEYCLTLQDLCWLTSREPSAPRACSYVLKDRELPHCDKAVEFLAHDASTPYINLDLIHIKDEFFDALPRDFSIHRAACIFGQVGGEPLVAMLNPFNLQLKEDIARLVDSEPHFYLTSASAYQGFLDRQLATLTP